jgi:hypothetical protein
VASLENSPGVSEATSQENSRGTSSAHTIRAADTYGETPERRARADMQILLKDFLRYRFLKKVHQIRLKGLNLIRGTQIYPQKIWVKTEV